MADTIRFVRQLQHRVTKSGNDFYALSVPPQVARALGLKDGGTCCFEVKPRSRGKIEVTLKACAQDDA